ncbi:MAG: CobW family GTP-binding protein [Candidatus Entotheonellia bacterium]
MIKTSCNLLTGFLGSGKTTLLKYIMQHGLQQKRVAIIMNEIGDIGIDGKVITGLEGVESMVEFNSGCVCCTIDDYRFAIAVQQIIQETKPDLLIIETTGLADPNPIIDRLKTASVARDAVITLVDAATFLPLSAAHEVLDEQVKAADFLVLNKIDLVTERERQKVEKRLRRLNRRALLLEASYGQVQTDLLFSTGVSAYRAQLQAASQANGAHAARHTHGQDAIQAFSYETRVPVDLYAFERFLKKLPSNVYRAKGLLQLTRGAFPHVFNFTCGRFDFQPLAPELAGQFPTQGVFIGKDIYAYKDEIISRFRACERADDEAGERSLA